MQTITHKPGEYLYIIWDRTRKGYLTWVDKNNITYLMAWVEERFAEDYNNVILDTRPGEICRVHCKESRDFVKKMIKSGVTKMVVDCPPEGDFDQLPLYPSRPYSIVDLVAVLKRW